jgi:uroporphyrinogen-III decarboxylase
MNTKERFFNALYRRPVDRPPVAAVATGITVEMMDRAGIFWPEAHGRADQLAGLAETIHLYTGVECIKLPFCMTVEVEALGAPVDYRTRDTIPTESRHIWDHPDQVHVPEDFLDCGRVPVVLQAVSALLALAASVPAILLVHVPPAPASVVSAAVAAGLTLAALAFGVRSYRAALRRVDGSPRLRVAAVSVDGDKLPGPTTGPAYGDVEGTIARYRPHLARAIA